MRMRCHLQQHNTNKPLNVRLINTHSRVEAMHLKLMSFFLSNSYSYSTTPNLLLLSRHLSTTTINRVRLYLQRAQLINSIRVALRSPSPSTSLPPLLTHPSLDSFILVHSLRSAPSISSALSLIDTLKTHNPTFTHTQTTLHTLAKLLAKSRRTSQLQSLITSINNGHFTNVPRVVFMDLLRWSHDSVDLDSAVRVWEDYKLTLPPGKKHPCTESYNLVMSLYAQKERNLDAVEVFRRMIDDGANPNSRTHTVVIKHLVDSGKLDSALEVFDVLPAMRVKHTLKQYSILVDGFSEVGRFDVVKGLVLEMRKDGILPGHSMKLALKAMQEAGYVEETQELLREMLPDNKIENVGICTESDDDDDDSENEESKSDNGDDSVNGDHVQLKPWLDPSALASALSDWNPDEVSALENENFVWTTRLVCKMLRSFKKAETAWKFFCWVAYQPGEFTHDVYTISRMIAILARHGHVELVDQLISKVKNEGILLSFSTMRLIIDFYGISKKADAALRIFRDVEAVSGPIPKSHLILLYSSMLRTLVKCKRSVDAMDIVEEMLSSEVPPDVQTFTALLQYFALEGDLRTVQKLFGMVRLSGVEPDAYMFQILIRAYCKRERATLALRVFEDMRNLNLIPDAATKALLVKSLWKEGRLREAALLEEKSEEINDVLPLAVPGHVWTVNNADLRRVYNIYSNSFTTNCG